MQFEFLKKIQFFSSFINFNKFKNQDVFSSFDRRKMKFSLLYSSLHSELNGIIFVFLALKDEKLLAFECLKKFYNNLPSINPRNIKMLPLDASDYDDSNKLHFIFLRSLDDE